MAVEAIYEAKERYAAAKERNAANGPNLRQLLTEARATERKLAEGLREHIEKHGCIHQA